MIKPSIFDNSWYPSRRDIKNHVYKTTWVKKLSQIDQVNLESYIGEWVSEDPSRKFYLRKCTKPMDEPAVNDDNDDDDAENSDDEDAAEDGYTPPQKISVEDISKRKNNFLYIHQDKWQRDLLLRCGNNIFLLDATYKTTKYNLPLFFVCVLTNCGYQIVGMYFESKSKFWTKFGPNFF